ETGIAHLANRSPYALSAGQQQRVAIASVLVMQPQVLLLDEPTSQLDPVGTREVFATVRSLSRRGITVVMAEHKLEWVASFADRVVLLDRGRVVLDGSPSEVLTSPLLALHQLSGTRYTLAALGAAERGLWPSQRSLPVTLDQAVEGFRDVGGA
ncbi:MAG: ABC transporter ATP-binding protein, partial [Chloroflexi bacterium]|nr:ABC transporter ATP-binding protein [Chloroflexota bacterium]